MKLNINTNNLLKILLLVLIIISSIFLFTMIDDFLGNIFGLLIPFIIAFTISFIVQPYILLLEKKGVKHNYAVFIIISILLICLIERYLLKKDISIEELLKICCIVCVASEFIKTLSVMEMVPSADGTKIYPYID
jgi:hypothetical protein